MTILAMPNAHPCLASVSGTASQRRGGRLSRLGVALGCMGVELPWSASSWASNTGALRFHLSREANAGSPCNPFKPLQDSVSDRLLRTLGLGSPRNPCEAGSPLEAGPGAQASQWGSMLGLHPPCHSTSVHGHHSDSELSRFLLHAGTPFSHSTHVALLLLGSSASFSSIEFSRTFETQKDALEYTRNFK